MTLTKEENNTHKQRKWPYDERPVKDSNGYETHFWRISTHAKNWQIFLKVLAYAALVWKGL